MHSEILKHDGDVTIQATRAPESQVSHGEPVRSTGFRYVIITPARNASGLIEKTIRSVLGQTQLPHKWIIIDDGSTDGTADVVRKWAIDVEWVELISMPGHAYDLSSKARCFNHALASMEHLDYDIVANVDADISFDDDYFGFLLGKFRESPGLGVAGTPMKTMKHDAVEDALFNQTDVFGACQVFRRECIKDIGGYLPLSRGGVDWAAVRMARMKGWETRSFLDRRFYHHRVMGATECGAWRGLVRHGRKDYFLGNHPLWQVMRVSYQMTRRPRVVGGTLIGIGYLWEWLSGGKRQISRDMVRFHQREQRERLRALLDEALIGRVVRGERLWK